LKYEQVLIIPQGLLFLKNKQFISANARFYYSEVKRFMRAISRALLYLNRNLLCAQMPGPTISEMNRFMRAIPAPYYL